jgi:hypothetical protein
LSRYFGILPVYLPRDQFLPSELVVPLVAWQSILPGLSYMEVLPGRKYKCHWIFSWSLEGSFIPSHRSSSVYSFRPYCQSCRTQSRPPQSNRQP